VGFYSAKCEGCSHPLLCLQATGDINAWMIQAVAITPDGSLLKGEYDGYGSLHSPSGAEFSDAVGHITTVWHRACWEAAGKPDDYRGESAYAEDQGWFFADGAHDMPEPTR
jgi:hypothetical protein